MGQHLLETVIDTLKKIKDRAEKSFSQVSDDNMFNWLPDQDSNSLSILIRHFSGNMKSRWTNFLTTDGEKDSRQRDSEFDESIKIDKQQLMQEWEEGWQITLDTISNLKNDDLMKVIYIRSQAHTVVEALLRQMDHYSAHLGQIIFIVKLITTDKWMTLSLPKKK